MGIDCSERREGIWRVGLDLGMAAWFRNFYCILTFNSVHIVYIEEQNWLPLGLEAEREK